MDFSGAVNLQVWRYLLEAAMLLSLMYSSKTVVTRECGCRQQSLKMDSLRGGCGVTIVDRNDNEDI